MMTTHDQKDTNFGSCVNRHEWFQWQGVTSPAPDVVCRKCLAAWRSFEFADAQDKQVDTAQRRYQAICPPELLDDPTDWQRLPDQVAANKVVSWAYSPRGVLAHGITGLGKTRAMWALIKRQFDAGRIVVAYDGIDLGREISAKTSDDSADFLRWVRVMERHEILYIDDLGKGRMTRAHAAELFGIIKHRTEQQRPTFISTNTLGETLANMLGPDVGPPMRRRLTEDFECIPFKKGTP